MITNRTNAFHLLDPSLKWARLASMLLLAARQRHQRTAWQLHSRLEQPPNPWPSPISATRQMLQYHYISQCERMLALRRRRVAPPHLARSPPTNLHPGTHLPPLRA